MGKGRLSCVVTNYMTFENIFQDYFEIGSKFYTGFNYECDTIPIDLDMGHEAIANTHAYTCSYYEL